MPLPLLFIGIAAATGSLGLGKGIKAGIDVNKANQINKSANELIEESSNILNAQRQACDNSLRQLGEEKLFILNSTMADFIKSFTRIKNVDFRESVGLDELKELQGDKKDFEELKELVTFAGTVAGGTIGGAAGGALVALGAYSAAQALACASTGTAIASLSGAAATNATLAFFGGGSLAAGGLGVAGGTMVLGGLVAGPALMVVGLVAGAAAKKNLDKAYTNRAEAIQIAEQLDTMSKQCEAIRRRTYMFYNLLARLDAYFLPMIYKLEDILKNEGDDYRAYSADSKKAIASCASIAVSIKGVLDTPMLTDDGMLTIESEKIVDITQEKLKALKVTGA